MPERQLTAEEEARAGQFHGSVVLRRDIGGAIVVQTAPDGLAQAYKPPHAHAWPYLWFLLGGDCEEVVERREDRVYEPFAVSVHPVGEVHSHRSGPRPPSGVGVILTGAFLERYGCATTVADEPRVYRSAPFMALAKGLVRELHAADGAGQMALESQVLALVAESERTASGLPISVPTWLLRAKNLVSDSIAVGLSVSEVAAEVGVHPVHLTREFRRFYGQTPGQWLRSCRLDRARAALAKTDLPVECIAVACGFYDGSHLANAFRAAYGVTPGAFRVRFRR